HLQRELTSHSDREAKLLRRARREGMREVAFICSSRSARISPELARIKVERVSLGDFHECHGAIGAMEMSKKSDFDFEREMRMNQSLMKSCTVVGPSI